MLEDIAGVYVLLLFSENHYGKDGRTEWETTVGRMETGSSRSCEIPVT